MVPSFLILLTKVPGLTDLHRETTPVAFQSDDDDDVGVLASPLNGFHKAADEQIASNTLVQETYHHIVLSPPKNPCQSSYQSTSVSFSTGPLSIVEAVEGVKRGPSSADSAEFASEFPAVDDPVNDVGVLAFPLTQSKGIPLSFPVIRTVY